MKLFVILFSIIACNYCMKTVRLSKAVPLEPRNNSHYVEGESRYIWMPDGDGKLHLVDLQASVDETDLNSRNGADNQYWLFTRRNPTRAQIITHGNNDSLRNSYYDARNPLMVIVHGWNSRGDAEMNTQITSVYLAVADANVIVVDWRVAASGSYTTSIVRVPSVGRFLGNFVTWVISNTGGSWNNVHLVGFSLGAHIVGNAGRTAGRRPIRITGLDPAGPQWGGNANALNRYDGGGTLTAASLVSLTLFLTRTSTPTVGGTLSLAAGIATALTAVPRTVRVKYSHGSLCWTTLCRPQPGTKQSVFWCSIQHGQ